jgi:RNA polymerase sigma-70 factor (ECF subfamily)
VSSETPIDDEQAAVTAAIRSGDQGAFGALSERYRRQLRVHCYRMLGSFGDAEDLVQETFLRAWRGRDAFEGRSLFRTWLYRIATNACLNALERAPRRVLPRDMVPPVTATFDASEARAQPPWAPEIPWLEPYPDQHLEAPAPTESEPEAALASRETIELAFLAALQHLPPRQRAALILCDVLGWSAKEAAGLLEATTPSVNSALERAHSTMRAQLPMWDPERPAAKPPTERERAVLHSFMAALEGTDAGELTRLLSEDVRWSMPPAPLWFDGRATIARLFELFPLERQGTFKVLATAANRQPAAAAYIRAHGQSEYRLSGVHVLRIERGEIEEIITFSAALCSAFALPSRL